MPRAPFRSWIEISRERIRENFRAVRNAVGDDVLVCPVVKADAYRHGAIEVAQALEQEGAGWFAVSGLEEGVALREAGISGRILLMADFAPVEHDAAVRYGLTPVLHSLADIARLDEFAVRQGARVAYHLKIDSGMGRLGVRATAAEVAAAVTGTKAARLEGLMTHFASAGDYVSGQTEEQIQSFESTMDQLEQAGVNPPVVHMSSTIAIAYGRKAAWKRMVRPGHAIYGYVSPVRVKANEPAPASLVRVQPALAWKAAILTVKDMPAGSRIGYGGMYRTDRPMRIGIVAAGYADGIPHRLSGASNRVGGRVIAGGQWAPILGAISMDVTTVDLSQAPGLAPGDSVTLIGEEGDLRQDAQQMARAAGTISYSILCGISARVHRVFVD